MTKQNKTDSPAGNIFDYWVIKRMFTYVKPYKSIFLIIVILTLTLGFLAPARPYLIQYTVDNHIIKGDFDGLLTISAIMAGLLVVQSVFLFFNSYLSSLLAQNIVKDIRVSLFNHISKLRLTFFDKTPIGRLVTRNISDIEALSELFSNGLAAFAGDLLSIIFILAIMLKTDWQLTVISLSVMPVLVLATYIFKEKMKMAFNMVRNEVSRLNTFVQENITGMNIVQMFGAEEKQYQKFKDINKQHRTAHIKTVLYYSVYFPVAEIVAASATAFLIWYGGGQVLSERLTLGTLIAFIMYLSLFFRPIRTIADRYNKIQMGLVSSHRILKLLDDKNYLQISKGTVPNKPLKGHVVFKNVYMGYENGPDILKNISFEIPEGDSLAIVGSTGSGKTTIINLLNRFYDYRSGIISIDGVDINNFAPQYLRSNIGAVLQDVFLFSGSIYDNLTLSDNSITKAQIIEAAKMVNAWSFIEKLPGQLDFNVNERGASLSVGQRQLLSFVRVLLSNPRILILDEATSSVDSQTEELLQKATETVLKNRTSIVIAHRLSTIKKAKEIIVLSKGEIIEQGNHQSLMDLNGIYTNLVELQYKPIEA